MVGRVRECYGILGLEPGASWAQVRRSYRLLVRKWHPDRFGHDPTFQKQAEEKLKAINLAYGILRRARDCGPGLRSGYQRPSAAYSHSRSGGYASPPPRYRHPAQDFLESILGNSGVRFGLFIMLTLVIKVFALFERSPQLGSTVPRPESAYQRSHQTTTRPAILSLRGPGERYPDLQWVGDKQRWGVLFDLRPIESGAIFDRQKNTNGIDHTIGGSTH